MRALVVLAAVLGLLGTTAGPATARPPFVAHLQTPGHHPKADHRWPITVTARSYRGTPLSGRVRYEFLYGGRVVSRQSNYAFRNGRFRDAGFSWPKRSIGIHLTLRVVVTTKPGVVRLSYWVVVRK